MSIDWITVSAQIVNFLILVWLLKRFLYKPVIDAMEKREQSIADRLDEAEQREQQAAAQQQHYLDEKLQLESDRDNLIAQAQRQAQQEKHLLLEQARQSVEQARQQWQQQVAQEQEEFLHKLGQQAAQSVQAIARKVLTDLANIRLEEQIVNHFIAKLREVDQATRNRFAEHAHPLRITTGFTLEQGWREQLKQAIGQYIKEDAEIAFDESEQLICGIALTAGGLRLSWNLNDYLEQLQSPVREALTQK